ncbi:MAG: type II toxin-antitoxin system VapC family toxin [Peptococcaceae bacterium]|jgi:predicted nucleic acid-binding protein|nr:type II toxin-antitoxin system VapC family toxin [Peptococcaceae bacterium]
MFVDTSAWCALTDRSDQNHDQAARLWKSIQGMGAWLYTSDYVMDETLTLLRMRTGHANAVKFGQAVQNSAVVEVLWMDEDAWKDSWLTFSTYHDKDFSFTDCTSFVFMKKLGLSRVFAFDRHFTQAGFQLVPGK